MQQVTPDIEDDFGPVKKALRYSFIPNLFQGIGEVISGRRVTYLPVKQAGMPPPEPTLAEPDNWTAPCVIKVHIVAELRGQEEFRMEDHAKFSRERREEAWKRNARRPYEELEETLLGAPAQVARHLRRVTKKGAWLMVKP